MKRRIAIPLAIVASLALLLSLAGCGNDHQVIPQGKSCLSCHSEDKETYDITEAPESAIETGTTLTVQTNADSIVVCTPIFTSEDGSTYTPVQYSTSTVTDGEVTLELDEGMWAIAIDKGDSSTSKLVNVVPGADPATIDL
ncbi:MAG: hypothetical protein LUD25_00335 [Coriobacteriaceae bacterium]|nr:hypothetical protein [Coriobacteriaceae bacterium]